MPTTFSGEADLVGSGDLASVTSAAIQAGTLGVWSSFGDMSAQAAKQPHFLRANFFGNGGLNVITISPRLVASARFVGTGSVKYIPDAVGKVLSTRFTHRYSFPVNPNVPFVRRPSARYYALSARYGGRGRLVAIATVV